jgi:hypothetical protein
MRTADTRAFMMAAFIAAMGATSPARAQLVQCGGVNEPNTYKVLLDDIIPAGGAPSPLLGVLVHKLDANLEQLKLETGLPLRVVRCEKRRPGDPAVFRKPVVQDLTARQVVLEVWGTTIQVAEPGAAPYHEASIGYAVVPVRFYEYGETNPQSAFVVPRRADSLGSTEALLKLVDQAGTLAAYAAVGAGTKLLKGREYDKARAQLCRAEALLGALSPREGTPDASLLAYVKRLAGEAVTDVRADAGYRGPLKVLPVDPAAGCGGAR